MHAKVVAVHSASRHTFSKESQGSIQLVEGHGVKGDAHFGINVKHRSRVAKDPTQPNLRQVHLLHEELLEELATVGFSVRPGQMGENITTRGIDLLRLSVGTRLLIGSTAVIEVTGLRNPCAQIENFKPGLLASVLGRSNDGTLIRKAGIMGVVLIGGMVSSEDQIVAIHQPIEFNALGPVSVWPNQSFNRKQWGMPPPGSPFHYVPGGGMPHCSG